MPILSILFSQFGCHVIANASCSDWLISAFLLGIFGKFCEIRFVFGGCEGWSKRGGHQLLHPDQNFAFGTDFFLMFRIKYKIFLSFEKIFLIIIIRVLLNI